MIEQIRLLTLPGPRAAGCNGSWSLRNFTSTRLPSCFSCLFPLPVPRRRLPAYRAGKGATASTLLEWSIPESSQADPSRALLRFSHRGVNRTLRQGSPVVLLRDPIPQPSPARCGPWRVSSIERLPRHCGVKRTRPCIGTFPAGWRWCSAKLGTHRASRWNAARS